jgi:hypothetical protein
VVDEDAGHRLELGDRARRPADGEGLVPHGVAGAREGVTVVVDAVRAVDQGVAGDADAVGVLAVGTEVEQEGGVGTGAHAGEAVDVVALFVPVVGSHDQDVERLLGQLARLLVRPVLKLVGDVEHRQVVVEVPVEVHDPQAGHHAQHDERRDDHLRHHMAFAALAAPASPAVAVLLRP